MPEFQTPFEAVFQGFKFDERENKPKNFGYLRNEQTNQEIFIHFSVFKEAGIAKNEQVKGLKVRVLEVEQNEKKQWSVKKIEALSKSEKPSNKGEVEEEEDDTVQTDDIDYSQRTEVVAYTCAEKAIGIGKEYKNTAKSLPMMIRANGLGNTLTFLKSKDKDIHLKKLYEHLCGYLSQKNEKLKQRKVCDAILYCDSHETKELTKEAIAFLSWLRRYSEGLIPE